MGLADHPLAPQLVDHLIGWESRHLNLSNAAINAVLRWQLALAALLPSRSPTAEGFLVSPGKAFNCLMPSVSTAAIPKAHLSSFGSLKYPLRRKSMPRVHRASGPVTIGCFFHSFPVWLTLASSKVNCCSPLVSPIETGSAPTCPDGIKVHYSPVSTKALYFCGSDVLGQGIHTVQKMRFSCASAWQGPSSLGYNLKLELLPLPGGSPSLSIAILHFSLSCCRGGFSIPPFHIFPIVNTGKTTAQLVGCVLFP